MSVDNEAMVKQEWVADFEAQNKQLIESGEEPLSVAEYVSCRLDDAEEAVAMARDRERRDRWAATYNAALGAYIARGEPDAIYRATETANITHGRL